MAASGALSAIAMGERYSATAMESSRSRASNASRALPPAKTSSAVTCSGVAASKLPCRSSSIFVVDRARSACSAAL